MPRDVAVAKKLVLTLTAVASAITVLFAALEPSGSPQGGTLVSVAGPLVTLVLTFVIVASHEPPAWAWAAFPLGATLMIGVSDVASGDTSVTAQLFFFFPVLYAGAQLHRRAAIVVCATAVLADVGAVAIRLPAHVAVVDTSFLVAALGAATGILVYSGEQVDCLVGALREQAAIDPLTGLVTRRVLDSAASSSLISAGSDGGTALIIVDVDHFKLINDEHGHPAGDLVLQNVAGLLMRHSRATDVTSRMGGDELAVLLPGCSMADALHRAEELIGLIRNLRIDVSGLSMAEVDAAAQPLRLTVSVGLAHLPTHAKDVHDLYRAADASLYHAKRAGRNQIGQQLSDVA